MIVNFFSVELAMRVIQYGGGEGRGRSFRGARLAVCFNETAMLEQGG